MKTKILLALATLISLPAHAATTLHCHGNTASDAGVVGTPEIIIRGHKVVMVDEGEHWELFCEPMVAGHLVCERQVSTVDIAFEAGVARSAIITVGDGEKATHGECR